MSNTKTPNHFIAQIVEADLASGKHQRIATRFPPEPNGYLHIGHAKSIVLNFGLARAYGGRCNLRFDDTNPCKESPEFVASIERDVAWLGYAWDGLFFASDYFEQLYQYAVELIDKGLAYVCDLSADQVRAYRGTLTEPGRPSPWRERDVAENRDLFARMRAGEFPDGSRTLRARIDMASPNINLRDPALYRIRHGVIHHQTGAEWCIYPMYDYAHPISDALECITHSICTLEFEDHRPFYDWVVANTSVPCVPRQIEFARLNLEYTLMSKRKLTQLVSEGHVSGWDDPRMPTIAGLRRRGYTPAAIRDFCERIGVAKADNVIEVGVLENCIREDLDRVAARRMAVLDPLRLVIENYPQGVVEWLDAPNHPKDAALGTRSVPFARELLIERDDFMESAPKDYKRLVPGGEVRLRNAYTLTCDAVIRDDRGEISELRCHYDPATLGRNPEGRKVRGVIHWVSAAHALSAEVRLYGHLFTCPDPEADRDRSFLDFLDPNSLQSRIAHVEPSLAAGDEDQSYQFERQGYFHADPDSRPGRLVFNRVVTLRESFGRG